MEITIDELILETLTNLQRFNYAPKTYRRYELIMKHFSDYAAKVSAQFFNEELGAQFLTDEYAHRQDKRMFIDALRVIRVLGDFKLHGAVLHRRYSRKAPYRIPKEYEELFASWLNDCKKKDYSKKHISGLNRKIFSLIKFLDAKSLSISNLSESDLLAYTATLMSFQNASVVSILAGIKMFLKFLYLNQYIESDLSSVLPHVKRIKHQHIPSVWKSDDVKKMLNAVDRGNPVGKRDYAILLMVTRLGLRVGDIKEIPLSALKWDTKRIEFTQQKTKRFISLPMLNDVGWALIEYLRYARPKITKAPQVFTRLNAPFEAFGMNSNLESIVVKYANLAGVKLGSSSRHGMHSLRHTLASALLEQNTPIPIISEILGHSSIASTNVYLKIDIEKLRRCALNPDEVSI